MKSSHYKTPRTLAECEFTVGYPIADLTPKKMNWWPYFSVAMILGIFWIGR